MEAWRLSRFSLDGGEVRAKTFRIFYQEGRDPEIMEEIIHADSAEEARLSFQQTGNTFVSMEEIVTPLKLRSEKG